MFNQLFDSVMDTLDRRRMTITTYELKFGNTGTGQYHYHCSDCKISYRRFKREVINAGIQLCVLENVILDCNLVVYLPTSHAVYVNRKYVMSGLLKWKSGYKW